MIPTRGWFFDLLLFAMALFSITLSVSALRGWKVENTIGALQLFVSVITLGGLILAYRQYKEGNERQRKIDENSVTIVAADGADGANGIFKIKNYGSLPHHVELQGAELSNGTDSRSNFEATDPTYKQFFCGIIKPKQTVYIHFFNISTPLENVFVYKGAIKVITDERNVTITKVRFSGSAAEKISDRFHSVHPLFRWVIYEQNEGRLRG